jgi:hypothetical protein
VDRYAQAVVDLGSIALAVAAIGGVLWTIVKFTIVTPLKNEISDAVGRINHELVEPLDIRLKAADVRLKKVEEAMAELRPNHGQSTYDLVRKIAKGFDIHVDDK